MALFSGWDVKRQWGSSVSRYNFETFKD